MRLRRAPDPAVEAAWASFCAFARVLDQAARAELPTWALPELAQEQAAVRAALDAADQRARQLPAATERLDFEHRNEAVGEVLDELAPVQDAEAALRRLRRRRRRQDDHG
jgi:hypothetical protein